MITLAPVSWERMEQGIAQVRRRLERAAEALAAAHVPYAIVIPLDDLVRMKLTSFRDKDRMHLRDLASVGLVDETWPEKYPSVLADRLRLILEDPEG